MRPLTPSRTRSSAAPTASVTTTGQPAASASLTTTPHGSRRDGTTVSSAGGCPADHHRKQEFLERPLDEGARRQEVTLAMQEIRNPRGARVRDPRLLGEHRVAAEHEDVRPTASQLADDRRVDLVDEGVA